MLYDKFVKIPCYLLLSTLLHTGTNCYQNNETIIPLWKDYHRIKTEEFSSVFLSTFPITNYAEFSYNYYRGLNLLKTANCLSGTQMLNDYFSWISAGGNEVSLVYLGVRPDLITADDFLTLVENWDDKSFEVTLAYPSKTYWQNLSDAECAEMIGTYQDFIRTVMTQYAENEWLRERLNICFYGDSEWLAGNPVNYENDFNVNSGISHTLAMYSDDWHGYALTSENYEQRLEAFELLIDSFRSESKNYPDLSDWDVVFFGDSVIAFTETSSIPGALKGITGANTYNCGIGGYNASTKDDKPNGITRIIDTFLTNDGGIYDNDAVFQEGLADYHASSDPERKKCFVLNLGLNDYFEGCPIESEDPYDIRTYSGALRAAIEKLRNAFPDCVIILMAPNFTINFEYGETIMSDIGGVLTDYVDAAAKVSGEENTLFFDSYHELGIDRENYTLYLLDGTHPNESTRFRMAEEIAGLLADHLN